MSLLKLFIDSVLIIDDKEKEVEGLIKFFSEIDVWTKHLMPSDLLENKPTLRNRKLIFLDLKIDESLDIKSNIALIRRIFKDSIGKDFGNYGIILWSKHDDNIEEFKSKMFLDRESYQIPLFIVPLDKNKYLQHGFETILSDFEAAIENNISSRFFFNWSAVVNSGKEETITTLYNLVNKSSFSLENLEYLLFHLAKNQTGIPIDEITTYPLHLDAYKAFNELLFYDINKKIAVHNNQFKDVESIQYSIISGSNKFSKDVKGYYFKDGQQVTKDGPNVKSFSSLDENISSLFSLFNSRILLDNNCLSQEKIIPGNIYEIIGDSTLKLKTGDCPEKHTPIIIEITPPCDFSQNRKLTSKCIGGFISPYSKKLLKDFQKEYHYKEIHPILISDKEENQFIIFDFRYFGSIPDTDLKDTRKFKLVFKAKDKLFADILQKFSSHSARLGLSVIQN